MINVAQCKGIQIPESGEFLIVESGIMGLEYNTENPESHSNEIGIRNSSSTDKKSWYGKEYLESSIHGVDPRLSWIHLNGAN